MKWVGYGLLVLVLAAPPARGDDPPKAKDSKAEASAQEQYDALVKEFAAKQQELVAEYRKAKGEEQQKILKQYRALGGEFADRFLKLAEANPKAPVGVDALFWVANNAADSPVAKAATDKLKAVIAGMPLKDLADRVRRASGAVSPTVLAAVLDRAEKAEKDPAARDLVAWVARMGPFTDVGPKAVKRLIEKYPDHPALEQVVRFVSDMEGGDALLKQLLATNPQPKLKAAATLGLGKALIEKANDLGDKPAELEATAAEAEKYLTAAIDLYKDDEAQRKDAEQELKAFQKFRVGKPVPEIQAPDLDDKEFKLSDYRGKVVLLDFWGNW